MDNSFNNWNNNATGDININIGGALSSPKAMYKPEPVWRSPITMAVLSWLGFFSSLGSLFSIFKVFESIFKLLNNSNQGEFSGLNQIYVFIFFGLLLITLIIFSLRKITNNQTRHPLAFNYALSGVGKRLTIEKIIIHNCPICNGKMKFYSKPIAWDRIIDSNGKEKRVVTDRIPVLECKRNGKHCFEVDPAEDKI